MTVHFGPYSLEPERYELRREGDLVAVEPQVLEVLTFLVLHRDRVVTKDELLEEIWKGRFVTDSALSRAIREVRRLLGDTGAESRWIKTVYGRGFAFVGEAQDTETVEAGTRLDTSLSTTKPGAGIAPLPVPLTPLIGREQELIETTQLLEEARLLTMTGAAGTGKSRLALALAERVADRFPDGVVFVSLAEVADVELVPGAIALALGTSDAAGTSPFESLHLHLRGRELLLILDNFEQLLEAAPQLAALLSACPGIVALVTSRFVLGVAGEQEYPVPPLALPDKTVESKTLARAPAIELFLDRARATLPSFDPEGEELAYVAEICRRVDGLPLAIELAAARVKMFSPQALWERLAGRLDLLSSPSPHRGHPYRTLGQALAWSYELLEEEERRIFRQLSIFSRSFTLGAVEQVCREGADSLVDLVGALVDKSLVERQSVVAGDPRFGLLETTRQFARQRLEEEGEGVALRESQAQWALQIALVAEESLAGGDQQTCLERIDAEYGNLLAAIEWARSEGDLAVGLAIGAAMGRYWSARGTYREGRSELKSLLDSPRIGEVEPGVRARALMAFGLLTHLLCEYRAATASLEEARDLLRSLGDRQRLAQVLDHLSWIALQVDPLDPAEVMAREALALHEELADGRGLAVAHNNLGWIALYRGDTKMAESHFQTSVDQRREIGDERGLAFALANLSIVRLELTEQLEEVEAWLVEARGVVDRLADLPLQGWVTCVQARLEMKRGSPAATLERLQASELSYPAAPNTDGAGWILLTKGETHQALDDTLTARECLQEAVEIWRSLETPWGVTRCLLLLAEMSAAEGDATAAGDLRREALELSERFGFEAFAEICRSALTDSSSGSE